MSTLITLPFPVSVNALYRVRKSGKGVYMTKRGEKFYELAKLMLLEQRPERLPADERLVVDILVYPPDKRDRDLDNCVKVLFDAVTKARIWQDDALVDRVTVYRGDARGKSGACARVLIRVAGQADSPPFELRVPPPPPKAKKRAPTTKSTRPAPKKKVAK